MPTLNLKLNAAQTPEINNQLAAALTQLTASILRKKPEVTVVTIEAMTSIGYFVAGSLPNKPAACLQINITSGTNTTEDKAQFIEAAFALLRAHLGELDAASYVIVHELPATDWGYGGKTQAARRAASLMT